MGIHKKGRNEENREKQGRALKRIFRQPVSTIDIEILTETGIWPAEQRIQ